MSNNSSKPYIVCHMLTSIDGKVTGKFLEQKNSEIASEEYYRINRESHPDAFACGKITMNGSFTKDFKPDLEKFKDINISYEDFINKKDYKFFAVSYDRKGTLGWKDSHIIDDDPGYNNAHIIEVLTEQVKKEYLGYLQSIGVSYIICGKEDIDLKLSLEKLKKYFDINLLYLEGGSILNGSFFKNNFVDEISLVVSPMTGDKDDLNLFDNGYMKDLELIRSSVLNSGIVHLLYKVKK